MPKPTKNTPRRAAGSRPFTPDEPYWLYGLHPVRAVLENPARKLLELKTTLNAARALEDLPPGAIRIEPEVTDRKAIDRLVPADAVHQGIAALVKPLPDAKLAGFLKDDSARLLVVLDQVTDPHNVGAIFRSAAAFGAAAVVTTRRHAPNETAVLVKAAAGTFELLPYVRVQNLASALGEMTDAGIVTVGLDGEADQKIEDVPPADRTAIVLGSEGKGLRHLTAELCTHLARLSINPAVESLNVSNAAAVALYALGRR